MPGDTCTRLNASARPAEDEARRVASLRFERRAVSNEVDCARQLRGKVRFMTTRFGKTDARVCLEIPPIMFVNERSPPETGNIVAGSTCSE